MTAHTCHARGCDVRVPPAMFMCKPHWFSLPKAMRDAVWMEYVPGQEQRNSALNRAFVREARRTCAACPVKVECGEFSQTSNNGRPEQWGVWSGRDMGPKKKAEPTVPLWKRVEQRLATA